MRDRRIDISGEVFGHLTAIEFAYRKNNKTYWRCACDCGKEAIVARDKLTTGYTQSCGHLRAESVKMKRGCYHKVEVSDKAKAWIIKHYCHTKNDDIKAKFGITDGWLHRFARANGLTKTTQFVHKCQKGATDAAKQSHLINGTYPPKGYEIPRSREFCFKAGVTPEQRLGKRKNAERVRKAAESLAKTRKLERGRVLFGLEQRTNLKVKKVPKHLISQRYHLRSRGYIVEGLTAYYDENTKRCPRYESRKMGDKKFVHWDFVKKLHNTPIN